MSDENLPAAVQVREYDVNPLQLKTSMFDPDDLDRPLRVFLAHPKAWSDMTIDEACEQVQEDLAHATWLQFEVTAGRDCFRDNFRSWGGWNGWAREVAIGRDMNEQYNFDVLVVPSSPLVGKATAGMVEMALAERKPVVFWHATFGVARVDRLSVNDNKNWQSGWELILGGSTT